MLATLPERAQQATPGFRLTPKNVRTRPSPVTVSPPVSSAVSTSDSEPEAEVSSEGVGHTGDGHRVNFQPQHLATGGYDVSGSTNLFAAQFDAALQALCELARTDVLTAHQVRIADVHFGNGQVKATPFVSLADWEPAQLLKREGDTPLYAAIDQALTLLFDEERRLRKAGVPIGHRLLFLMTDGAGTDKDRAEAAKARLNDAELKHRLHVFPIALGHYIPEIHRLSRKREALVLKDENFPALFNWLGELLSRVSRSQPGDDIPLPSVEGWATLKG